MLLLKGVVKKYQTSSKQIVPLAGVSIDFPAKGIFAIKGRSGEGKSTFLNIISLLETPDSGGLFFKGKNLITLSKKKKAEFRNEEIGFLFQKANLIEEETVLFNVIVPLLLKQKRNKKIETQAFQLLKDFGIEALANKKAGNLSGGEKQRVGFARALISSPSIILADEPTGALDSSNALVVMKRLKEESKKRLVLLVSHDEKLISTWADSIFELKGGKLLGISPKKEPQGETEKKKKGKSSLFSHFLLKHLKEDRKMNFFSFFSLFSGLTFALVCVGILNALPSNISKEKLRFLESGSASWSESKKQEIEGSPLVLSQSNRPSRRFAERLFKPYSYISVEDDYSFFFPMRNSFSFEGSNESLETALIPVTDLCLREVGGSLLSKGKAGRNDLYSCLVNEAFEASFGNSLGKKIVTSFKSDVYLGESSDVVISSFSMFISGVIKEFGYMATPKVYYSYPAIKAYYASLVLPNISKDKEEKITLGDLVRDADGSEAISSYSFLLFCHDGTRLNEFFDLLIEMGEDQNNSFYCAPVALVDSFASLGKAFILIAAPFVVVALVSSFFIMYLVTFFEFSKRKKEAGILSALGMSFDSLSSIYIFESSILGLFSSLASIIFSFIISPFLNTVLSKVLYIPELIDIPFSSFFGIRGGLIGIILLFSFLSAGLTSLLSLSKHGGNHLVMELRDE